MSRNQTLYPRQILVRAGKYLLCGGAYFIGLILGGMAASLMGLPQPPMPDGVEPEAAALALALVSPVLAWALSLIAQELAGGWLARALTLSFLTYVAYTLNTVLDAALYVTAYASTSGFTTLSALAPSLFCGGAVALLFPPREPGLSFFAAWNQFFGRRSLGQWVGRFLLASISFMPIYLFFGLLADPFTGAYYRQELVGLRAPGWEEILPVLFARSLLFLLACLPVFIAWQQSGRSLLLRLGTTMFVLVGFLYMLIASWLPVSLRIAHSIEILADSFVYVGVLTWLLSVGNLPGRTLSDVA